MKKLTLLFALAVSVYFISCKDDKKEEPTPVVKSTQELLTNKNWVVSKVDVSGQDIWSSFLVPACNKDNQYKFRTDDTLVMNEMATKCDPADPQTKSNYYKIVSDKRIYLDLELTSSVVLDDTTDILELTETSLKLSTIYSGLPAVVTFSKKD